MDNIPSNTLLAWTLDANKALDSVTPETSKEVSVFKKALQSILKHEKLPTIDDKFKESITEIQDMVVPVKKENQSEEEFEQEILEFRSLYGVELEQLEGFQKIVTSRISAKINDLSGILNKTKEERDKLIQAEKDQKMSDIGDKKRKRDEYEEKVTEVSKKRKIEIYDPINENLKKLIANKCFGDHVTELTAEDIEAELGGEVLLGLGEPIIVDLIINKRMTVEEAFALTTEVIDVIKSLYSGSREVILEAVNQVSLCLKYASDELKSDMEVVLAAVNKNGLALYFASPDLKNNKNVVLAAVKQNGRAFQFASNELKNDKEFVLEAVKQNGSALKYASDELRNDKQFILEVNNQVNPSGGSVINYLSTMVQAIGNFVGFGR